MTFPLWENNDFESRSSQWHRCATDAPLPLLHEPWRDGTLLKRSDYPAPMVDLGESRRDALAAYQAIRL